MADPPRLIRHWLAPLLLLAVLWTQIPLVKATNFFGFDEWTVLVLLSKGVIDIPYANRPLELLWALPVPWIAPHGFLAFAILHWMYLWLTGVLVAWISFRLAPSRPLLAFLGGVFVMTWAPTDAARLSTVERTLYGGITFGMTLCMAIYVESWVRRSVPMLALSLLLCVVSGRCYEATLPVLFVTPLLLIPVRGASSSELRSWILALESFVLLGMTFALQPLLFPTDDPSYQAAFGLDTRPEAVLTRAVLQYRLHFQPLFTPHAVELLAYSVGAAALVFAGAGLLWLRQAWTPSAVKGDLRMLVAGGLLLCGAGYGALLLSGHTPGPWRMQFLSSPGAALCLAGVIIAVAERFKRSALVGLSLGVWVVAVGTGRTLAMQEEWDRSTFYTRQMRMLSSLIAVVPDVEPGSVIVLLDDGKAWRANFGFHHAVEYVYRSQAEGLVWGTWPGMFPAFFGPEGVASLPWPAVRAAWGAQTTFHRYDQIVVVRHTPEGATLVLDQWPSELPTLPAGAPYVPRARIRSPSEPIPERRALRSLESN